MKYSECICYGCPQHKNAMFGKEWDCGCESAPVFDPESCLEYCPYKYVCDVALNPIMYPTDDVEVANENA